jgi:release factor glutamine methyltransferase
MAAAAVAHTVQSALAHAHARGLDAADVRALLVALLDCDRAQLIAHSERPLTSEEALTYEQWVGRRACGEPVAYVTGRREFYGRDFLVTPAVLIPRPETELLVDLALETLRGTKSPAVLDLGTGSGCLALTIAAERADAVVTAIDASAAALDVARTNGSALGLQRVRFVFGNWYEPLRGERFHLIVANPPYIASGDPHLTRGDLRYEPRAALTPGLDGGAALRAIIAGAPPHLEPGGTLWCEHGYDQGTVCRALLSDAGLTAIATHRDLAGIERASGGTRPER